MWPCHSFHQSEWDRGHAPAPGIKYSITVGNPSRGTPTLICQVHSPTLKPLLTVSATISWGLTCCHQLNYLRANPEMSTSLRRQKASSPIWHLKSWDYIMTPSLIHNQIITILSQHNEVPVIRQFVDFFFYRATVTKTGHTLRTFSSNWFALNICTHTHTNKKTLYKTHTAGSQHLKALHCHVKLI